MKKSKLKAIIKEMLVEEDKLQEEMGGVGALSKDEIDSYYGSSTEPSKRSEKMSILARAIAASTKFERHLQGKLFEFKDYVSLGADLLAAIEKQGYAFIEYALDSISRFPEDQEELSTISPTEESRTSNLTEKFDFGDRFSYGTPRDSSEFNEIAFQADEKTIEFNGHGILTEKQVIQLYYKMYDALGEVPEIR